MNTDQTLLANGPDGFAAILDVIASHFVPEVFYLAPTIWNQKKFWKLTIPILFPLCPGLHSFSHCRRCPEDHTQYFCNERLKILDYLPFCPEWKAKCGIVGRPKPLFFLTFTFLEGKAEPPGPTRSNNVVQNLHRGRLALEGNRWQRYFVRSKKTLCKILSVEISKTEAIKMSMFTSAISSRFSSLFGDRGSTR